MFVPMKRNLLTPTAKGKGAQPPSKLFFSLHGACFRTDAKMKIARDTPTDFVKLDRMAEKEEKKRRRENYTTVEQRLAERLKLFDRFNI